MKKFLILVLFLCLASTGPAVAVTVPPWWMIQQSLTEATDKSLSTLSVSTLSSSNPYWMATFGSIYGVDHEVAKGATYTSEIADSDSALSNGVFTCPTGKGGLYQVSVLSTWSADSAAGYRRTTLLKNGSPISTNHVPGSTTFLPCNTISCLVALSAGDTLSVTLYQSSTGGTVLVIPDGIQYAYFMGLKVR